MNSIKICFSIIIILLSNNYLFAKTLVSTNSPNCKIHNFDSLLKSLPEKNEVSSQLENFKWSGRCQNGAAVGKGVFYAKRGKQDLEFEGMMQNGFWNGKVEITIWNTPKGSGMRWGSHVSRFVAIDKVFEDVDSYKKHIELMQWNEKFSNVSNSTDIDQIISFYLKQKGSIHIDEVHKLIMEKARFNIALLEEYYSYALKKHEKEVWEAIRDLAFKKAKEVDSYRSYSDYSKKFQESESRKYSANRAYEIVKASGKMEEYLQYTKDFSWSANTNSVIQEIYHIVVAKNTIPDFQWFIGQYPKAEQSTNAIQKIYNIVLNQNSISDYQWFISQYPKVEQSTNAVQEIYNIVLNKNNISGFQWFLNEFPECEYAQEALTKVYEIAYLQAELLNTVSAYNTFVCSYPAAPQTKNANEKAYMIEKEQYTDIGILGIFGKDNKMEKAARKLLIKAKQMERAANNQKDALRSGYIIVANRMYDLLQREFDDTEATLRYLESQEFQDFLEVFKITMDDIKVILHEIQTNTVNLNRYAKRILEISEKGFNDANADRDMAEFYATKHREWEKFMHYRDKGYN